MKIFMAGGGDGKLKPSLEKSLFCNGGWKNVLHSNGGSNETFSCRGRIETMDTRCHH